MRASTGTSATRADLASVAVATLRAIEAIAANVQALFIEPLCNREGWRFTADRATGAGWYFTTADGQRLESSTRVLVVRSSQLFTDRPLPLPELRRVAELLDMPTVFAGKPLGAFVRDYSPARGEGGQVRDEKG